MSNSKKTQDMISEFLGDAVLVGGSGSFMREEVDVDCMSFDDMRKFMARIEQKYPQYTNIRFYEVSGWDDDKVMCIKGDRPATDADRAAWSLHDTAWKLEVAIRDRKEFTRLKKKFSQ